MLKRVGIAAAVIALTGCGTIDTMFVGTYSRVGIDVSSDGAGAGIGVKNVALTIMPTKQDGSAYDLIGTSDIDLAFRDLAVAEIVATGDAAKCASGKGKASDLLKSAVAEPKPASPLIFAAATSWSLLEVSLGEGVAPGISFGYKRTVGIRMPIKNEAIGSAYASVHINTKTSDHTNGAKKSEVDGTRSTYVFATGASSVAMAQANAKNIPGAKACTD